MDKVLDTYLKDLLVLHDCVILPDFGGFVGSYKPAEKTDKDYFNPPRKVIAFNQQLKQNDGLLANTIVAIEKISYEEAMQHITAFVTNIEKELNAKGTYTISEVGKLETGKQGKILFTPDARTNFLLLPTGMSAFHFTPQVQLQPTPATEEKEPVVLFPIFRKVLVAGVSGLALFSLLFNPGKVEHLSLASLFPTHKTEQVIASPEKTVLEIERTNDSFEKIETNKTEIKESNETVATEAVETSNEIAIEKNYHVIVGCFSIEENAKILQQQLEAKNISSRVFAYNNMLTGVSAGSFGNFAEAKVLMDELRKNGNAPSAWVLKRKNLN